MRAYHGVTGFGLLVSTLLSSCGPGSSDAEPTCQQIGAHLDEVCGSQPYAERARSDCEVYGMDQTMRACLMRATDCSVTDIDQPCHYVQMPVACTATPECHAPLICFSGQCAECGTDADCTATGEVCRNSVCFVPDPG